MVQIVEGHRATYGVEPICPAIGKAPSTFCEQQARQRDPERVPARSQRDGELRPAIVRCWHANQRVYGAKTVWEQLNREGVPVARFTVARLMRGGGLRGVVRERRVRTTIPEPAKERPRDRVPRDFRAARPNQLWVADFTYVATRRGFVYVAFVTDVFSRRLLGWRVSTSMRTDLTLDALEQALNDWETDGQLIHLSDNGCQYLSITYTERLALAGIEPSIGSRGDSYDNTLLETIIGLFKTEVIHHRGRWKGVEDVEFATLCWVSWNNTERIMELLGYLSPAEYEAQSQRA